MPLQFHTTQVFDEIKHVVDVVAKKYLEKATGDVRHLVPVEVNADGNCLYQSIVEHWEVFLSLHEGIHVKTPTN